IAPKSSSRSGRERSAPRTVAPRIAPVGSTVSTSDPRSKPSGAADGRGLPEVRPGVHDRDPAQDPRARTSVEALHHALRAGAEPPLGCGLLLRLGRDVAAPVEALHPLARAASHRVAILAERGEVDLLRQLADLWARHADPEIAARDAEL